MQLLNQLKEENKMERKEILVADKITKIYGIGTKTLFEALHEVSLTMYEGSFWSRKINFY